MKKKGIILLLILVFSLFLIGISSKNNVSAADGDEWVIVTDAGKLKAGDEIVIVAKDYNFALSTTQNSNNRGQASVTKDGDKVIIIEFCIYIRLLRVFDIVF